MIYVCIPVYNRINLTLACINSLNKQTYKNIRIIICDDGSTDSTSNYISENYPKITLIKGTGLLWWAGAINECVKEAMNIATENDFIFTLNNDTELLNNTLEILVKEAHAHPNSIWAAVNVFYSDKNTIEPSAFIRKKRNGKFRKLHELYEVLNDKKGFVEVDLLSGKGVLIPVNTFTDVGLFNAKKLPHYHADIEFIHRAKKSGYKVYYSYDSRLLSHQELSGSGTWTSKPSIRKFLLSFFQISSAHYLPALFNYSRLIYEHWFLYRFVENLFFITGGFIKRYVKTNVFYKSKN
jgi:GT2 family glycosyltransferase